MATRPTTKNGYAKRPVAELRTIVREKFNPGSTLYSASKDELIQLLTGDITALPVKRTRKRSGSPTRKRTKSPAPSPAPSPVPPTPVTPKPAPAQPDPDTDRTRSKAVAIEGNMADMFHTFAKQAIETELGKRGDLQPIVEVTIGNQPKFEIKDATHNRFATVLRKVAAGVPVLLVGPAGSGKTKLAEQVAEALGRKFTFNSMSAGISETALLGRTLPDKDGNWTYRPAQFVTSYEHGGVHLLDEIDAADPNLLVQINAAIANQWLSIPFRDGPPIRRHKDSIIIAAANTFGHGADRQYVGRNALDAATLNRFTMGTVEIDYDRELERKIAAAMNAPTALLDWAWAIRDRIASNRVRRLMSTRNIIDSAKLIAAGESMKDLRTTYFADWTNDERAKVDC